MRMNFIKISSGIIMLVSASCMNQADKSGGKTEILKWPDGKRTAISLTYDDGSINQFRIALPLMDSLELPATFYIITGQIPGSTYQPGFIGRPGSEIIRETASVPTNRDNLFERASFAAYAPWQGLREYHTRTGELFESGRIDEACKVMEEAFEKIRNGELKRIQKDDPVVRTENTLTWEMVNETADRGHEFGSHTITHPRLSVLDESNMLYELEKSKLEILDKLGEEHTFSAECPYGTEDERVMEYAFGIYPALRNRMPADYLTELNRGSRQFPGSFQTEYVQWQRGPLTDTPMGLMKSWIDSCLIKDNVWLVLVFHGVEGIGWESKSRYELVDYFDYINRHRENIWIATFGDVTRYIRERMSAVIESKVNGKSLMITISHDLDRDKYDLPLTLLTYLPDKWKEVRGIQDDKQLTLRQSSDERGDYVIYEAMPNAGLIRLTAE